MMLLLFDIAFASARIKEVLWHMFVLLTVN